MGGKGSGGARVGAGRRAKTQAEHVLAGTAAPVPSALPPAPPAPIADVPPPADLPLDQLALWQQLAPFALEARTLTPATALAFRDLCEAIVVKRALLAEIQKDGWTRNPVSGKKAHPLLGHHRGMMQRVEAGMARFKLAPIGKELSDATPTEDPFSEFDQGPHVRPTH
jgi:phage terminase small subunit